MNGVTQWEVVMVIVVLVGLVGSLYGALNKFTQPIQELKESIIKLTIAFDQLNNAIARIDKESSEHEEFAVRNFNAVNARLDKHKLLLQQIFRFLELEEEHDIENK